MQSTLVFCGFGLGAALDLLNAWLSASSHRGGTWIKWMWMLACVLLLSVLCHACSGAAGDRQAESQQSTISRRRPKHKMKIFQYIAEFALEVAGVIPEIIALAKVNAITAAALLSVINPAVSALQSTFGVSIPPVLVTDIVTAVADAINAFHKKTA